MGGQKFTSHELSNGGSVFSGKDHIVSTPTKRAADEIAGLLNDAKAIEASPRQIVWALAKSLGVKNSHRVITMTRHALIRARHNIQLTTSQRAMRNRPRPGPMNVSKEQIDRAIAKVAGRPHSGQTIEALSGAAPENEMDAGFYAALLLRPAKVGRGPGEVPAAVSDRLYDAGLVRRVE